ncbi:MAG: acyl-CoA reductase [Bacteroidota bacterium]|nr:acyl-CoA reductase [Bacteroidota bacterium]
MLANYISGIENKWTKALKLKVIEASIKNPWFTKENIDLSLKYWSENLTEEKLHTWLSKYEINTKQPKTIAVVMAGNFPLAGFHDFLCVLITGNNLLIKFSNNDEVLLKFIIEYLIEIDSSFKDNINIRESIIKTFDKVIATGSNNTSRYFDYYFKDKPSIIRKNRFSIGILTGKENRNDLEKLSNDIFTFFGLGCRNVSKIFVPKNYNFDKFFKSVYKWRNIINNHKYASNYNYNRAINLIDIQPILENGFLILKESKNNYSPISVLLYEYYNDTNELKGKIELIKDDLQCIVSKNYYKNEVAFGETQNPTLYDYADNIDTIEFLLTK